MAEPDARKTGRGTDRRPPNRFERLSFEPDPDAPPDEGVGPATVFLKEKSRTILSANDSPDIPFEASLNPYRGCEHGCSYCLAGETPTLMADGTLRAIKDLRPGDRIYGTERRGWYRRYVETTVLDQWLVAKPAFRVTLEDGTRIVAGGDHRFLTERGWKFVTGTDRPRLTLNNKLMGVGHFSEPFQKDKDYETGYLCGMIRGDAHLGFHSYPRPGRSHGDQHHFRSALVDREALERSQSYLQAAGVQTRSFVFQKAFGTRKAMSAVRTHAKGNVGEIRRLIAWPEAPTDTWTRGFLAGIFDAEGSYSGGVLRVANKDPDILRQVMAAMGRFGFQSVLEDRKLPNGVKAVRLRGGLKEHLRFFHSTDPAILRKRGISGQAVKSAARLRVRSVEPVGTMPLYDIKTGTGDFIADGVISHNCYARPYHEYLGFSSGLDFETKIVVKEDAPRLLREELSSPRWKPKALSMSGVTDCYQPAERRFKVTRGCLEVLAEFRNPVGIVTKNFLVTRDVDVLQALAKYDAAVVLITITTLDEGLSRILEPRASRPAHRLAAVEAMSKAGIPVGVMVAPVIPALTDHEMPRVLKAAADAGARAAAYTVMRLPYAVKDIFTDWLERHFPDRKKKVLHRIEELRGGRLNDPNFGSRMTGQGIFAQQIRRLFEEGRRKAGMTGPFPRLSTAHFRRPGGRQMTLFGE